jgi:hypothetical protein
MRSRLAVLLLPSLAMAQDPDVLEDLRGELAAAKSEVARLRELTTAMPLKVVSGSFGIDFTTQYFFRGILQENQGVIGQPWIDLGYGVLEGAGWLRDLDLKFGMWNSLHDGPTGGAGSIWYENDAYVGLAATLGERVSVGTTYTVLSSPNGGFGTVEELALTGTFDDRGLLFASGLRPSMALVFELDGQADAGNQLGTYLQLGLEPSFAIGTLADVTFAVPVELGLSLHDYYEQPGGGGDDFFGFLDVGISASTALSFLPERAGPWRAKLGLDFVTLGDSNQQRNADQASEWILSFGLSTSF